MRGLRKALVVALGYLPLTLAAYAPLREYRGSTFFDAWDFYGSFDNTTWGNVTFLDRANASSKGLAFVNSAGNAIVKVDNTSTVLDGPVPVYRDSIRITSRDTYGFGSLIIMDAVHIPYGCSVWPSFWALGNEGTWPASGEIDIIESINLMNNNQVALHSNVGCSQGNPPGQSGRTIQTNCNSTQGCLVAETKPNSFGAGFAQAGGGVYAVQMEVSGIYVWFFSRPDIPENIKNATSNSSIDTSTWGLPTAGYPLSGCNLSQFFGPQQLVLLTTLCGLWAGIPDIYASTCHTPTGSCYHDNILGDGSNYATAYWEIQYIRAYVNDQLNASLTTTSSAVSQSTTVSGVSSSQKTGETAPPPATTSESSSSFSGNGNGSLVVTIPAWNAIIMFTVVLFSLYF